MVDAVFFDVDGVLLDTIPVKGQAFVEAFEGYPNRAEEIRDLHHRHGGVPRDLKIALILKDVYGRPVAPTEVSRITTLFTDRVLDRVLAAPEIAGASKALARLHLSTHLHAISATPQSELQRILDQRGWVSMFRSVHGVPPTKAITVGVLLARHKYAASKCVYVGDSEEDRQAARLNGVPFVFVSPSGSGGDTEDFAMVPNLVSIVAKVESVGRMGL